MKTKSILVDKTAADFAADWLSGHLRDYWGQLDTTTLTRMEASIAALRGNPEPEGETTIVGSSDGVTVCWKGVPSARNIPRGTMDLVCVDGAWWLTRALVQQAPRSRGLGSRLLRAALHKAVSLGAKEVFVGPGGYGSDEARQRAFYQNNHFQDAEGLDGVLVWRASAGGW